MAGRRRGGIPWAGLGLMVVTLMVLAVVLEFGFRLFEEEKPPADPSKIWAIYDKDLAYRNRPFFGDHNAQGHRDHPLDEPKSRFRMLVLADSVAYYGDNVDDTWPGKLEILLAKRHDVAPVEVVNSGVRGWTIWQERKYLEKYGLALKPDVVCLGFVLNDVHRILHRFKVKDGKIVGQEYAFDKKAVKGVDSPIYRLARKSHLLVWLRSRLTIFDDLVNLYTRNGYSFDYRPDFNTAWEPDRWPWVQKQIQDMVDLGRKHGFRVFVVVVPFADQLRPDYLARDRAYVTFPQRKLKEIGGKLGVPVLDLMPYFDASRDMDKDRVHLTESGRTITAERVADFVVKEHLVPPAGSATGSAAGDGAAAGEVSSPAQPPAGAARATTGAGGDGA